MVIFLNKKETGQAMVEFALVFPVFLLLLFAVIDFGWLGYQQLLFESTFQMTAWDFKMILQNSSGGSLSDIDILERDIKTEYVVSSPGEVVNVSGVGTFGLGEGIRQHMLQSAPGLLDDSCLYLTDASAKFWIEEEPETYNAGGTFIRTDVLQVKAEIDAELRYEVEPLTPLTKAFFPAGKKVFSKSLVRERLERVTIKRSVTVPGDGSG